MDEGLRDELRQLEKEEGALRREDRINKEVEARKSEVVTAQQDVKDARRAADVLEGEVQSLKQAAQRQAVDTQKTQNGLEGTVKTLQEEVVGLKSVEVHHAGQRKVFEDRYKALSAAKEALEQANIGLERKLEKQDAMYTATMQQLQGKCDSTQEELREAVSKSEKADISNQKDTLLLKLFKEQVEHKDMDLDLTKTQLREAREARDAAEQQVAALQKELSHLEVSAHDEVRRFSSVTKELKAQLAECEGLLDCERNITKLSEVEIAKMKERIFELVTEQRKMETERHKGATQLNADVKLLERRLAALDEDKQRDDMEARIQIERLSEESERYLALHTTLKEKHHEAQVEAHQKYNKLHQEHEILQLEYTKVNGQVKASETDTTQKIASLIRDAGRLEDKLQLASDSYTELERLAYEKEVKLQVKLEEAGKQIARLEEETLERDKVNKDAALLTWHEREEFKLKAAEKVKELEVLRAEYEEHRVKSGSSITSMRKRQHDAVIEHRALLADLESKNHKLTAELTAIVKKFDSAVSGREEAVRSLGESREATEKQVVGLQNEIAGYKETVTKLEAELIGNYDKKALASQNEELKSTLQTYRNQITSLNHTISSIRIEAEIIESHKTKALQASNTQNVERLIVLQEQLESYESLLCNMIPLLQPLTPAAAALLQSFKTQQDSELALVLDSVAETLPVDSVVN